MLANALSEKDFQRQVTDLAEILGFAWAHFRPAQTARGWRTPVSGPLGQGFPDLVLVRERDRRLIFAELKSPIGEVSYDQEMVMASLRTLVWTAAEYSLQPSIEVYIWRPSDLPQIAEILR